MKLFITSKKGLVLLATMVVAVVGAVGAYAYWTTTGSGSGSGSTTTNQAITVNQTSASSGLYPGGLTALAGNFSNPAAFPQYVTSVSASIDTFSFQADPSKPPCTQGDFYVTGSPTPVGAETPVGTGGGWSGIALHMGDALTNQDNCKNISVPLTYSSN